MVPSAPRNPEPLRLPSPDAGARSFSATELAELCGLPLAVLQRWVEHGLLKPREGAPPRFGFRATGTVRTLAELRRAGWTAPRIKARWIEAQAVVADPDEALSGLLASVGEAALTVRTADGRLVDTSGQQLFDFAASASSDGAGLLRMRAPEDWFAIGVEAEASGRLHDAARAYEHALSGRSAETHFNLGNCYYELKRRHDAATQFAAAVGRAPDYAEAWNNLGIVRGELGDGPGAVSALERALALVPHYADAHYNLAEALSTVGELDRARQHWRAYLTFDPNSRWAEQARRRLQNPLG
ncbi:MAG: tetratricopeptide repeat protein [Planctomycetota bacterium]